jgi:hypothetical protein
MTLLDEYSSLFAEEELPLLSLERESLDPSWLSPLRMTEEEERELSASDGDHESSSPHAARNAHNTEMNK